MFNGAESHKAQWKFTLFGKERESRVGKGEEWKEEVRIIARETLKRLDLLVGNEAGRLLLFNLQDPHLQLPFSWEYIERPDNCAHLLSTPTQDRVNLGKSLPTAMKWIFNQKWMDGRTPRRHRKHFDRGQRLKRLGGSWFWAPCCHCSFHRLQSPM